MYEILHPTVEIVSTANGVPTYASPGSTGLDIMANLEDIKEKFMKKAEICYNDDQTIDSIVVHPGGHCLVPTGIYTSFGSLYDAQVRPRSGNALKCRITITNSPGTIDSDYRDEWGIIIDNEGDEDFIIHQSDKIAQVVFAIVCHPKFVVKETREQLSGPDRGGGYGHSTE